MWQREKNSRTFTKKNFHDRKWVSHHANLPRKFLLSDAYLTRKKYRWIYKNNWPPGYFINIGKIYNVSILKYTNNLYTNYLLYGGVETVGLGLTFWGGWEVACFNACTRRLLFTIVIFLKVNSKRKSDFTFRVDFVRGISAWSIWK